MLFYNPFLGIIVLLLVLAFIGGIFRHMVYGFGYNPFGVILAIIIGMMVIGALSRPMWYPRPMYGYGGYYAPRPYAPMYAPRPYRSYPYRGY